MRTLAGETSTPVVCRRSVCPAEAGRRADGHASDGRTAPRLHWEDDGHVLPGEKLPAVLGGMPSSHSLNRYRVVKSTTCFRGAMSRSGEPATGRLPTHLRQPWVFDPDRLCICRSPRKELPAPTGFVVFSLATPNSRVPVCRSSTVSMDLPLACSFAADPANSLR